MRLLFILSLLGLSFFMQAQSVTGSWYGLAEATAKGGNNNNYLTELVIKQKGNEVEGIFGYYFRSGYQSYYIRGKYNPKTRLLTIKNLPVSFYKNRDIDGIECPMDFSAVLFTSKVKSTLKGSFKSHEKYKYTCPGLIFNSSLDVDEKNQDSLIKNSTLNIKKYWKPREEELVINTKDISTTTAMAERMTTEAIKDSIAEIKKTISPKDTASNAKDTLAAISTDSTAYKIAESERKKELEKLVVSFEQRKTILSTEVEIESDSVRISFYDNGDIDGDSITIFINKVPVLTHQPLSEKALNMYLAMDNAHANTEISMFAENLGKYPPNTALMVITDGSKRKEVFLSSSLTQNSSVILKKRKR
ncbi:MAG: hypothetical protein ABIR15_02970 [Chitinophagaceae bacterium]